MPSAGNRAENVTPTPTYVRVDNVMTNDWLQYTRRV